MSFKQPYTVGLHSVGSYQVAGTPYLTGAIDQADAATVRIQFPYVTNRIIVRRKAGSGTDAEGVQVHFRESDAPGGHVLESGGHHYWSLDNDEELDMRVKCKEIHITNNSGAVASWQLYAELTNINAKSMFTLTGSGITD